MIEWDLKCKADFDRRNIFAIEFDSAIAAEISDKWKHPCEGAFEYLAIKYPESLLQLIASGRLNVEDLTFAAEIAGRIAKPEEVMRALRPLLSHSAAVVREGAIYGLATHLDDSLRVELRRISNEDASAGVRTAAADVADTLV